MRRFSTTVGFIANGKGTPQTDEIIEMQGYDDPGDGGGAQWRFNGNTGQTVSQTPVQLDDALFNDASGNQWALVFGGTLIVEKLGGLDALQAALNANPSIVAWFTESYNMPENAIYRIFSNTHVRGPGINSSTLFVHPDTDAGTDIFKNEESSPDGERTPTNIKISDFAIDGSLWEGYTPWLSDPSGDPITDPEADYEEGGIIGDGGDIFDVVDAGRRNAGFDQHYSCITLNKVFKPIVDSVKFLSNGGWGVFDAGCYGTRVRNCEFIDHGRIDNISSGVWAQSFGTPQGGQSFYMPTEDHVTEWCYFECNRSAITMNATKGGAFRFNTIAFSGEAAVFSGSQANSDGGRIDIHNNKFGPSTITDITAAHVEANNSSDYYIYNNEMSFSDMHAINCVSGVNISAHKNTLKENVAIGLTYPFGPFSERFNFNVGQPPIAGDSVSATGVIETGSFSSNGANNHRYTENAFIDTRDTSGAEALVSLTKGASDLTKNITISDNDRTRFVDTSIPLVASPADVMNSEMSINTQNNIGDVTESPVVILLSFDTPDTGSFSIDCGFRPSYIEVFAAPNNANDGSSWIGRVIYDKSGNTDFGIKIGNRTALNTNDAVRLENTGPVTECLIEFTSWDIFGASFSVTTITKLVNVRFVCYP